ncbi:hypothetical protein SAMN05216249_10474 [Acetitomaculum ruminis DSM 5522]|uniref:Replication-associated protein ORF2/G2P domain-containing protein n=1 Tax=Acetitomaculum ruminis DSM 5522 TaxID=1120918 RepID=A0A1I0WHA5_9FIRM|nr:hypothetical protein [Acetitomaculum ruminis]SFA87954.1 hypothetical protein SAMN05216249_10474 [Acetitomaculum ruminis DSM 5522]
MYWKDTWTFKESVEYEFKWAGQYGAKGEKRQKKLKATPDQIKKQNQYQKEKKIRRLIKANFKEHDFWCCLKYPKGTRKPLDEVKKDLAKFLRRLRRDYKKKDNDLKFIYRVEIGSRGGIHIHFLCNRTKGDPATDIIIQSAWEYGRVNFQTLYDSGGYDNLAKYIVKKPNDEQDEQMSMFPEEEKKELVKYSSSRNLIRPEPERKIYKRWTLKKVINEGIKPREGYYIDKDSIVQGVNPYTGFSYLQYTEVKIKSG